MFWSMNKSSVPLVQVAEVFTGSPGKYVDLENTISGFKGILDGKYDDLPEMAFYMVGDMKEVQEKAARLVSEAAQRKDDATKGKVSIEESWAVVVAGILTTVALHMCT